MGSLPKRLSFASKTSVLVPSIEIEMKSFMWSSLPNHRVTFLNVNFEDAVVCVCDVEIIGSRLESHSHRAAAFSMTARTQIILKIDFQSSALFKKPSYQLLTANLVAFLVTKTNYLLDVSRGTDGNDIAIHQSSIDDPLV